MGIFHYDYNGDFSEDDFCRDQKEYKPLPWEKGWLTPISFLKSVFLLLADARNSICSLQPINILRAYIFSLIVYSIHTLIAYFPLLADLFWGRPLPGEELIYEVIKNVIYLIVIPGTWAIKETFVSLIIFYFITRKKIGLRITIKICFYASIFIFIYWIPVIRGMDLFVKGVLIGSAISLKSGVGLSQSLLASTLIGVLLTIVSYLPIRF